MSVKAKFEEFGSTYKVPKMLFVKDRDVEAAEKVIGNSEEVIMAVPVEFKSNSSVMVITNERVVIVNKPMVGREEKKIILWNTVIAIDECEVKAIRPFGQLIIKTKAGVITLDKVAKDALDDITNTFISHINK